MKFFFAPLQGYTDAAYRRFHNEIFDGCIDSYYTPFLRVEHGDVRAKDLRDILPENNQGIRIVPQIIVKNVDEFLILMNSILPMGYQEIDINMGCPFPLQLKKGRGAALLDRPQGVKEIMKEVACIDDVRFSVKMRLGNNDKNQWQEILPILNDTPLHHITLHSRIATQQYKGDVDFDLFSLFQNACCHKLVYNGDITTIEQLSEIKSNIPNLYGVMIGRGLLSNPSLVWEYVNNTTLNEEEKIERFLILHNKLFQFYESKLQGESHLLTKMKTIWDYSELLIGRKALKMIKKANNIAKYAQIVSSL